MDTNKYVEKKICFQGRKNAQFLDGTKVIFHVKVDRTSDNKVLDDSREWKEPVELILGKKFKLEVWESCVRTMAVDEVSQFTVNKKLLASYPVVSKTLRDYHAKKAGKQVETSHRCCGLGMKEGLGYPDLDELVKDPQDLIFTIELLRVENEGSYQKEFWAMTEDEQVTSVETLREDGNHLYKEGKHTEASKVYSEAIARLDNLMLKEKPRDVEWTELNNKKIPLLLNYSQCQLLLGEYYTVIEHCSEVLKYDPDNVKALYRRGRAYVEVFSGKEARSDLEKVLALDPSLDAGCRKILHKLEMMEKDKLQQDKEVYKKLFS